MKYPLAGLCFSALFLVGACRTAPRLAGPPSASAPESATDVTPPAIQPLSIPRLTMPCLGYAMSPSRVMPVNATPEETKEVAFENYYGAFLNVQGQTKYIACLEKDGSEKALADRDQARTWLEGSRKTMAEAMKYFPAEKRIVDAKESYSDVDAKKGRRRVIVTFQDGTTRTVDRYFDRLPPSKP